MTALQRMKQTLAPFTELQPTMPLQYVRAFLEVALEEGLSVTEYAGRAGVDPSVMTRHLADLGETNRYHEPGFDLLEQKTKLTDRRFREIRLTAKGKAIVKRIVEAHKR